MKSKSIILSSILFLLSSINYSYSDQSKNDLFLNNNQIIATLRGKRIYLSIPVGGEFPLNYYIDQFIDGNGETTGLGFLFKQKDSGNWWVEQNKMCQKWSSWYDSKPFCFKLKRIDQTNLYWVRDDGLEGTARIGETVSR